MDNGDFLRKIQEKQAATARAAQTISHVITRTAVWQAAEERTRAEQAARSASSAARQRQLEIRATAEVQAMRQSVSTMLPYLNRDRLVAFEESRPKRLASGSRLVTFRGWLLQPPDSSSSIKTIKHWTGETILGTHRLVSGGVVIREDGELLSYGTVYSTVPNEAPQHDTACSPMSDAAIFERACSMGGPEAWNERLLKLPVIPASP